ncbi:hypothetical protein ES708_23518 [subsurface metagenome]
MAKLKAPLMSLGASGALGKAIVFFNWKGLDVVREYVVPANPKTDPQNLQRGYMIACVTLIHAVQSVPVDPFDAGDVMAYSLLGSLEATPRTWFNTIVRQWLKQKVAGKIPAIYRNMSAVGGSEKLTVTGRVEAESSALESGKLYYGTSKSALVNSIDCTKDHLGTGKDIPNLTAGVKYYVQFRALLPDTMIGSNSGILYGTPTA